MRNKWTLVAVAAAVSGLVDAQVARPPAPGPVGGPLAGLTARQLADFEAGLDDFVQPETPETGLGPLFNGRSCVECHGGPAPGGSSPITVTRFGRNGPGGFDPLEALGGSLLQRFAIPGVVPEHVPRQANVVAQRESTPLFGLGLVEAIPDRALLDAEARAKPDGVAGRAARVIDVASGQSRIGRLGWKAQHATLLSFSADAYRNEMGITNVFFPTENAPNGDVAAIAPFVSAGVEDAADAAGGKADFEKVADFARFLAPPPRAPASPSSAAGEGVFGAMGCATCHTPTLFTGPNAVAALDRKPVSLYSDLLLHDMGALGDGIVQGDAGAREMRTAPLWGARFSAPYLHDGRAATLDQAIRLHDGEARRARDRYVGLAPAARQQLLDFLGSL